MTPEEEAQERQRLTTAWLRRAGCEDIDEIVASLNHAVALLLELQHRLSLLPTDPPRSEP